MSAITGTEVRNYDGSIVAVPQQLARPETLEELQAVLADSGAYPSPVRAVGSYHSLTPCASSDGTVVSLERMKRVVGIDREAMTFTAEAGLEMIEANRILREQGLQFMLNIEIGNMTLGSAACCQTKDALDGVEHGQVNSYVTCIKWVSPSGGLEEASETRNPELLPLIRSSYGLAGVVYEVTFRIKPLEIVKFDYELYPTEELTQDLVTQVIDSNEAMVAWTIGNTTVLQTRNSATELNHEWLAEGRQFGWNFLGSFTSHLGRAATGGTRLSHVTDELSFGMQLGFYRLISKAGGFTLHDPDKMVDYSKTPRFARYAFTFWAFPRDEWVVNLKDYVAWRDDYQRRHDFGCNLPLGSYFIKKDTSSLLSYTYDGDIISIDPIHAPGERGQAEWDSFLREFNDWAYARGGIPLLNQSPFVTRAHVEAAFGERWQTLCEWLRSVDPEQRMVNEFFADLLV